MAANIEHFIDLATRPLRDNAELRLSAESELRKSLEEKKGNSDVLEQAVSALEDADRHPHRGRWRIAIYVVTLVVSLPLLAHTLRQMTRASGISGLISTFSGGASKSPPVSNLTAPQKLLLSGDERAATKSDRWKPLWESEPENPAYLAEYAAAYFSEHKELSPEILAAVQRVDPSNGWFTALSAAGMADGAVTREKRSPKDIAAGKAATLKIDDEARMRQTLELIHQLVRKPQFTTFQMELLRQRIPLFPPRTDFVSQIPLLAYVGGLNNSSIPFRRFADVLAAGALQCAEEGDVQGFQQIIADWHALVGITSRNGESLIDLLVAKVTMSGPAEHFRDAAYKLGLEDEAIYFEGIHQRFKKDREERDRLRRVESPTDKLFARRASLLGGLASSMLARQVHSPPPITDDDMRPARYADYALFGRAFSVVGWMLLGMFAAGAAGGQFGRSALSRGLSARMLDLLRRSDWVWIFLIGLVFPVLWYLAISRLSPLAAREWSIRVAAFIPSGGQFGSLLASLIILPVSVAGHLLGKRAAVLGLAARFSWFGWLAAGAALAGVPVFGAISLEGPLSKWVFGLAMVLAGVVVVWFLVGLSAITLGKRLQSLHRATLARMVLPVAVAGMLVMALSIPFHYAEERRWIQQDRLGEISADSPAMSHYEYLVTQVLRGEILEMLGNPPAVR